MNKLKLSDDIFKRFEFDLRFKYSPVVFMLTTKNELEFLYYFTTEILELATNNSFVSYLLENLGDRNDPNLAIKCCFVIDLDNNWSDVYSWKFAQNRSNFILQNKKEIKSISLPDYLLAEL